MELFNEARGNGTAEDREAHLDNRDLAVAWNKRGLGLPKLLICR